MNMDDTTPLRIKQDPSMDETKAVAIAAEKPIPDEPVAGKISSSSQEETAAVRVTSPADVQEPPKPPSNGETGNTKKPGKAKRWPWILGGILAVVLLTAGGGYGGYKLALNERITNQASVNAMEAVTQYQLALADETAGQFETARQRLEYVIQLDSKFPGAVEKLSEIMVIMAQTSAPTIAPTSTPIPIAPTPDTRNEQQMYEGIQTQLRGQDWEGAVNSVELLRKTNLSYQTINVDGFYYIALRNRGMQRIMGGSLEGGMYDLARAEKIGPLDHDAESYRTWARYYLTGASYWMLDWGKVVDIFSEIYASLPNLSDGTGWTVSERYRVACIHYADQLAAKEQWCDARYYYDQAFALGGDAVAGPTATAVRLICEPLTPTPTLTSVFTLTPTATLMVTIPAPVATEDLSGVCCTDKGDGLYNPSDTRCPAFIPSCPVP